MSSVIITGERLQSLTDVYIGTPHIFFSSPVLHVSNQLDISILHRVNAHFNNPPIVFIYPDVLNFFCYYNLINKFINPFVLVTHNSDIEIVETPLSLHIANHPKLIHWFGQNVCFSHPKIQPLPIGIANSKWEHGDLSVFDDLAKMQVQPPFCKTDEIYMCFNVNTSLQKRSLCKSIIEKKGVPFLANLPPRENVLRLSRYKYCICPEGHGVDTHRLWEALYTHTVPIVVRSPFIQILQQNYNYPMIILDTWDDFDAETLPDYSTFDFNVEALKLEFFKECIEYKGN